MKTIEQYKCDHCGTLYADKNECEICEKQHKLPVEIVSARHLAHKVCAKYPTTINIKFDDGSIVPYQKS